MIALSYCVIPMEETKQRKMHLQKYRERDRLKCDCKTAEQREITLDTRKLTCRECVMLRRKTNSNSLKTTRSNHLKVGNTETPTMSHSRDIIYQSDSFLLCQQTAFHRRIKQFHGKLSHVQGLGFPELTITKTGQTLAHARITPKFSL